MGLIFARSRSVRDQQAETRQVKTRYKISRRDIKTLCVKNKQEQQRILCLQRIRDSASLNSSLSVIIDEIERPL